MNYLLICSLKGQKRSRQGIALTALKDSQNKAIAL